MRLLQPILTLALAIGQGWGWGSPVTAPAVPGHFYHHSGCAPRRIKRQKSRKTSSINQRQVRKNRRRANAAGFKNAFC